MNPRSFCSFGMRFSLLFLLIFTLVFILLTAPLAVAQTTQPFLFAGTYNASNNSYGLATLLRNSTTGALTLLPNTVVSFKDPCVPSTIDPTGNFLFGVCGEGVAMYTLDPTTGIVAETSASPYAASVSTGQSGVLVAAESTGQFVYLLKVGFTQSPTPSTFTLDTFQIDPTTPALIPVNSQSLPSNATYVASAADPSHHGIFVFVSQAQDVSSPVALLFPISFDLSTGAATVPTTGINIGDHARSLAISPSGGYLALGWGETMGSLTVYQISTSNFSMSPVGNPVSLGLEDGTYGSYSFPDSIFFSPGGNVLYVQAPSANFSGGGLPFLVFDPSTATQLYTPPIQLSDANFLNGLMDPQAPFSYTGNSAPTYGISVYQVDLSTGLSSQPAPISSPFYPQMDLSPLFVTVEQGGQGIQGPTLGANPDSLTFSTTAGQTSAAQAITLKSLGAQSVSLSSIQISGVNAADFAETDTCTSSPVLPTNHTCAISVSYSPSASGTSQATLFITDNAAGSPQFILLSGTAVVAPPSSPAVTLNPASTLTFPAAGTQGVSSAPQTVTLTNSGSAALQILSSVFTGFNSSDFNISADTCSGSIAAKASCTISIVFSPTATGVRTTTLSITDNAANSPQSLTVSGTASAAVSITAASGSSTTATLTAGQTAQFKLQATPAVGFSGTLSLSCSGAPFGATCTVPSTLSVSSANPASFTVTITTLAASQIAPVSHFRISPINTRPPGLSSLPLALALLFLFLSLANSRWQNLSPRAFGPALAIILSLLVILSGIGCGGGSSSGGSSQTPTTPGTQAAATPVIQPAAGTFASPQPVSIIDSTAASTIYYTTDGSTPSSSSPVYSAPFTLNAATTVQAMASASGYNDSSVATSAFKFRTGAGTYPITISVSATATGTTKSLQLDPISLTLIVN